jgi:hypothetical protein
LSSDPALCGHFEDALPRFNGNHYWKSIDPRESLNRTR